MKHNRQRTRSASDRRLRLYCRVDRAKALHAALLALGVDASRPVKVGASDAYVTAYYDQSIGKRVAAIAAQHGARDKMGRRTVSASGGQDLVKKFEKFTGKPLRVGRLVIKGYPVDIDDQSPDEGGLALDAVDRDAADGVVSELRRGGFKVKRASNTLVIVEASNRRTVSAANGLDERTRGLGYVGYKALLRGLREVTSRDIPLGQRAMEAFHEGGFPAMFRVLGQDREKRLREKLRRDGVTVSASHLPLGARRMAPDVIRQDHVFASEEDAELFNASFGFAVRGRGGPDKYRSEVMCTGADCVVRTVVRSPTEAGWVAREAVKHGGVRASAVVRASSAQVDTTNLQETKALAKRLGLKVTVVTMRGPGGGWPEVKVEGPEAKVQKFLSAGGYEDVEISAAASGRYKVGDRVKIRYWGKDRKDSGLPPSQGGGKSGVIVDVSPGMDGTWKVKLDGGKVVGVHESWFEGYRGIGASASHGRTVAASGIAWKHDFSSEAEAKEFLQRVARQGAEGKKILKSILRVRAQVILYDASPEERDVLRRALSARASSHVAASNLDFSMTFASPRQAAAFASAVINSGLRKCRCTCDGSKVSVKHHRKHGAALLSMAQRAMGGGGGAASAGLRKTTPSYGDDFDKLAKNYKVTGFVNAATARSFMFAVQSAHYLAKWDGGKTVTVRVVNDVEKREVDKIAAKFKDPNRRPGPLE